MQLWNLIIESRIPILTVILTITILIYRNQYTGGSGTKTASFDEGNTESSKRNTESSKKAEGTSNSTRTGNNKDISGDRIVNISSDHEKSDNNENESSKDGEETSIPNPPAMCFIINNDTEKNLSNTKNYGGLIRKTSTQNATNNSNNSTNEWRCACETGFLPPGLLKSFGGLESMVRMSTGQCYHKT